MKIKKALIIGLVILEYSLYAQDNSQKISTIFLVRHAEPYFPPYEEEPPNPHLNYAGQERAKKLMLKLRDISIDRIYSTERFRTIETVRPLADLKKLSIIPYHYKNLEGLAGEILANPGTHVISGHSNTTTEVVELLGGDPGEPINNMSEFDRLYMLVISNRRVLTYQLRYGRRYE